MKTCFKCNTAKDRTEFYRDPKMADGVVGKCKACTKADIAAYRRDPIKGERIRAYDRERGNRQTPEYDRAYKRRYPEKTRARTALGNAVRAGRVVKPSTCQQCGAGGRIHGHHHDYTKALDVQWLCQPCHVKAHRKYA